MLVERLPALARTHRVFAGITVPDLVSSPNLRLARIHNLLKAVINRLLGSSVIGTDHRVQSDRLEYRVALLPLWLAKHGVDVPAAVARYFAALGEPWREVLEWEREHDGKPMQPFDHPAHTAATARKLIRLKMPEEEEEEAPVCARASALVWWRTRVPRTRAQRAH